MKSRRRFNLCAFATGRLFAQAAALVAASAVWAMRASGAPQQPPLGSPDGSLIVSEPYRAGGRDMVVSLWRQDARQAPDDHRAKETAFLLVASSSADATKGRIVWAVTVRNGLFAPPERWSAGFARHVGKDSFYVVLVRSFSLHAEFRAYQTNLGQDLGAFPPDLQRAAPGGLPLVAPPISGKDPDPGAPARWPQVAPSISTYELDFEDHDISGVAAIRVASEGSGVTVHCKRELASTPPVAFHFDAGTKKWSRAMRTKILSQPSAAAGRNGMISVWRQDIPLPEPAELESYLKQHPDQENFPNTAFLAVVSDAENAGPGRIVRTTYAYCRPPAPLSGLPEAWMTALTQPNSGSHPYLVLAKATTGAASFRVYQVALEHNLGSFPIDLEPAAFERWPRAAEALSNYDATVSWLSEIRVDAEGDGLTVHCSRELANLPVAVHFDPRAKKWNQLEKPADANGEPVKEHK